MGRAAPRSQSQPQGDWWLPRAGRRAGWWLAGALLLALAGCGSTPSANPAATPERSGSPAKLAWLSDYEQGVALARREGKPLMVEVWAEWCSACKRLDEEVFSRPDVAAASRSFVLVRVDGDKQPELKQEFAVSGYPTIIFLRPGAESSELARVRGAVPYQAMLKAMSEAARKAGEAK